MEWFDTITCKTFEEVFVDLARRGGPLLRYRFTGVFVYSFPGKRDPLIAAYHLRDIESHVTDVTGQSFCCLRANDRCKLEYVKISVSMLWNMKGTKKLA